MDNESRKFEIKRKLLMSQHPRRADATFDEDNDHNPLILQDCPRCRGTRNVDIHESTSTDNGHVESWSLEVCPLCHGSGTTYEIVRYFDNETSAIEVKMSVEGWIKCPCCNWKFALKDTRVWTGRRHKRCGQKLNILK